MNDIRPGLGELLRKTAVVHTVTYFVCGVAAYLLFDYETKFSDPKYASIIRPMDHPLVMAGPLFQPLRGLLFALIFYPLREVFFGRKNGWLILWWTLLGLGIFNTFGPAPCGIEGMIYSPLPFWDHITGLPETVVQSLALAFLLHRWVTQPHRKGLSIALYIAFVLVIVLPILGLVAKYGQGG